MKLVTLLKYRVNIREGERERIQVFEGTVIAIKGSGLQRHSPFVAFHTVLVLREYSQFTPNVEGVKVVRSGHVRRAKLYYLRDRVGKAAKVKEDISNLKGDIFYVSFFICVHKILLFYCVCV